jgi:hypothetical protein
MNQTCNRCGPAVLAAYRVDRDGELYLRRHCTNQLLPVLIAQGRNLPVGGMRSRPDLRSGTAPALRNLLLAGNASLPIPLPTQWKTSRHKRMLLMSPILVNRRGARDDNQSPLVPENGGGSASAAHRSPLR